MECSSLHYYFNNYIKNFVSSKKGIKTESAFKRKRRYLKGSGDYKLDKELKDSYLLTAIF